MDIGFGSIESLGPDHIKSSHTKQPLLIVYPGFLQHLGRNGDGRVNWVANHVDYRLDKSISPQTKSIRQFQNWERAKKLGNEEQKAILT